MAQPQTGTDELLATLADGVLTLTLNRPEAKNAMTPAMNAALIDQIAWAEAAREVRCVVVTGAGGAFSSGGDVKGMASRGAAAADESAPTPDELLQAQRLRTRAIQGKLFTMPKPTLAVLPGAAAGAGMALALACDLRIMSSNAFMTTAFSRVGLSGDGGGAWLINRLVGAAKARELYFLSDRVSAEEALRLGLTNWVCAPEELAARTAEIAGRLAAGPSVAYGYMKENLNRALTGELDDCFDVEIALHHRVSQTEDHKEATRAFVEKRQPAFKGR